MKDSDVLGIVFFLGLATMIILTLLVPPAIVMLVVFLAGGNLLPTYFYVQGVWALITLISIFKEVYGR